MKSKKIQLIKASEYANQNPTISLTKIASIFGVDRHSIPVKDFEKYTFEKDNKCYYFEEKELEIIQYWNENPTISFCDLKRKFGMPSKIDTLKRWLDILGYSFERHYQIQYNRNAFQNIETEEDAYWLGFLLADGYISEDRWLVQLKLAKKDIEHLRKFLKYLNYSDIDNNIKTDVGGAYTRDNKCSVVKVNGEQIVKNLQQYNLFQKKSGKEIPYKCQTVDLEKAYIRGIIDGDGFLRTTQDGFGIVGSYEVLKYIKDFIQENICDVTTNSIMNHGTIYKIEIHGINKVSTILQYFYKNAHIYLDRKYSIFKEKYNN